MKLTGYLYFTIIVKITTNKLEGRQDKAVNNNDTLKEHTLLPIGSAIAAQGEDDEPWSHCMVTDYSYSYHSSRS